MAAWSPRAAGPVKARCGPSATMSSSATQQALAQTQHQGIRHAGSAPGRASASACSTGAKLVASAAAAW
jgi:hypothetical protein